MKLSEFTKAFLPASVVLGMSVGGALAFTSGNPLLGLTGLGAPVGVLIADATKRS